MMRSPGLFALTFLLSGCQFSVACDTGITPAITVAVLDATTGLRLAEASAEATRWTSAYSFAGESATGDLYLFGTSGTYTVTVRRAGYLEWVRTGVAVRDSGGSCPGPIMESLEAELVAAPG